MKLNLSVTWHEQSRPEHTQLISITDLKGCTI